MKIIFVMANGDRIKIPEATVARTLGQRPSQVTIQQVNAALVDVLGAERAIYFEVRRDEDLRGAGHYTIMTACVLYAYAVT